MTDYDKTVNFRANSSTVAEAKAKLEHGEMSEELRATLERIAHGADVAEETRLKDRLQTLRSDRRDLREERDQIEHALEEVDRDIERVEEKLDQLRETDGEYNGMLQSFEADLHEGIRIKPSSKKVKEAARLIDATPEKVIDDLRERNPDVPDEAFRAPRSGEDPRWKSEGLV